MDINKVDSLFSTAITRCLWMVLWLCCGFLVICPETLWAASITGNVFEDINYGGGSGRNWATASGNGGQARPNARVELFNNTGSFVTSVTTDTAGNYSFAPPNVIANNNYIVRIVSSSVTSSRTGYVAGLRPVMIFRTNASTGTAVDVTDYVGGHDPATADAGNAAAGWILDAATGVFSGTGSGKAHAFAAVRTGTGAAATASVNFGWNFNTIVNTNNTGQGSLRQFITNANTLGGDASLVQSGRPANIENAIFMISNGTAAPGLRASNNYFVGGVAMISPASALPTISTPVILNAQLQPGWTSAPLVRLDGAGAAGSVDGLEFANGSGGSTVRGLMFTQFSHDGVIIQAGANNITISGNWFGSDGSGTTTFGNTNDGIEVFGANTTIGGSGPGDRNVIVNNRNEGINIAGASATGNVIIGNFIGLEPDGTNGAGNGDVGIAILPGASGNTIGGLTSGERNVISMNFEGIEINTANNIVQGNYIGTDATGVADLGQRSSDAVQIVNGATGNTIGGTANGAGNLIAFTKAGRHGVSVQSGAQNRVLGNMIHSNSGLGLELGNNGVTVNDGAKTVGQPNLLMDFPVFTSAQLSGTTLTVAGYIGSGPNQAIFASARVEVFKSDNDASGYGEGQTYLGFLTSDANGNFSGTLDVTGKGLNVGDRLTGTATDISNNTSEFGPNFTCTLALAIVKQTWEQNGTTHLGSPVTAPAGATLVFLIYVKNTTAGQVTDVRINDFLDQAGFDYVSSSLVRTLAASPPADTATDSQIFDATAPAVGTALSDSLDGDVGSALDTGAPAGVDRITIGAVTGQANGSLTINAHTTFALRFNVRIR